MFFANKNITQVMFITKAKRNSAMALVGMASLAITQI